MFIRRSIIGAAVAAFTLAAPMPANANSPTASCIGQQLSTYGPTYGAELGAAVSYEARHPESIGVERLGDWTSTAARSARTACPVD
jgi:hypothetical protein